MSSALVAAYSATGGAWAAGPERVYTRLAEETIARSPVPLAGRSVLDVGAGTGAAGRAALHAGASNVVAVDAAIGMLLHASDTRPPAVAADALALPFADDTFGGAIAAFSLNHLRDPDRALREIVRVVRRGGPVLATAYAADDTHPVKRAVEDALLARGWIPPEWYDELRREVTPLLATVDGSRTALADAGLEGHVVVVHVPFADLSARDLIEWRLGMAQHAPFVMRLACDVRAAVVEDALHRLPRDAEPLVRSIIVIAALSP